MKMMMKKNMDKNNNVQHRRKEINQVMVIIILNNIEIIKIDIDQIQVEIIHNRNILIDIIIPIIINCYIVGYFLIIC